MYIITFIFFHIFSKLYIYIYISVPSLLVRSTIQLSQIIYNFIHFRKTVAEIKNYNSLIKI